MPSIFLGVWHLLTHLILTTTIIPILQIRKRRLKEVKDFWIHVFRSQIPSLGAVILAVKGEDVLYVKAPIIFRKVILKTSYHL